MVRPISISYLLLYFLLFSPIANSKVYRNAKVGEYKAYLSLQDCQKNTFLHFMRERMYPTLVEQSKNRLSGSDIRGISKGEGVELRLAKEVSTYHVKYKAHWETKAEKSGRSFSAVGTDSHRPQYLADASYAHYLTALESLLEREPDQFEPFFKTILSVLTSCDGSGFSSLSEKAKQVAADFIAVYVAEQYRHLISGKGKRLGNRHNWDDAHLQVTLLAALHSGARNTPNGMFYEGNFETLIYNQIYRNKKTGDKWCLYKKGSSYKDQFDNNSPKRSVRLKDYWQFNKQCTNSGVNITRGDFLKMGRALTSFGQTHSKDQIDSLKSLLGIKWTNNTIDAIANFYINNSAPESHLDRAQAIVEGILDYLRTVRQEADEILESLSEE